MNGSGRTGAALHALLCAGRTDNSRKTTSLSHTAGENESASSKHLNHGSATPHLEKIAMEGDQIDYRVGVIDLTGLPEPEETDAAPPAALERERTPSSRRA